MTEYDYLIERFALSYPDVIGNQPNNLKNFYKYGLGNHSHYHGRIALHDYSKRAEVLDLLPDVRAIITFQITKINDKYSDKVRRAITGMIRSGDTGFESVIDLAIARKEIIPLVNPYLLRTLQDSDFTTITNRMRGGRGGRSTSTRYSSAQKRESDEDEQRSISFSDVVWEAAAKAGLKTDREVFEQFLSERKVEWNPKNLAAANWFVTGSIYYDSIIRRATTVDIFSGLNKILIKILDFDDKFMGIYGIIPQHQWAKQFLYEANHERFVYLEISEAQAVNKAVNLLVGQPLLMKVQIPNREKIYPGWFDSDTIEYDGKIPKTNILKEKYVYVRQFNPWIYNDDEVTDSTSDYRVSVQEIS